MPSKPPKQTGLFVTGPLAGAQPIRSPMKLEFLPRTVQAIIAQAGGLGLPGAFVCVGAHAFSYRCLEPVGEYVPATSPG